MHEFNFAAVLKCDATKANREMKVKLHEFLSELGGNDWLAVESDPRGREVS